MVVPNLPPTSVFLRELFCAELVASAAWKITTVNMSPGCEALRSPLIEAQLEPRSRPSACAGEANAFSRAPPAISLNLFIHRLRPGRQAARRHISLGIPDEHSAAATPGLKRDDV